MTSVQIAVMSSIACCLNACESPDQISWACGMANHPPLSWLGVPVEFFHAILREDFSTNLKFSYREKNDASLGCRGRQ